MKKILIVINTLNGGGAEKVLLETVKHLDKNKYTITVLSILNQGIYIDEIKEHCEYRYIFPNLFTGKLNKIYYSIVLRLLKVIPARVQSCFVGEKKHDIAIAYLEGAPTKMVSELKVDYKFAWVHVDPIQAPYSTKAFLNLEREKKAYTKFNKVLCVSSDLVTSVKEKYKLDQNVEFLMNILNPHEVTRKAEEYLPISTTGHCEEAVTNKPSKNIDIESEYQHTVDEENSGKHYNIVTIGRLAYQKNYELLIHVCNDLVKAGITNFTLNIIGQGPEEKQLKERIYTLGLKNKIHLLGFMSNPYPYIKAADFAVCSSRAEGFSTFVTEALILAKPLVTTDCAGMKDLLGDSEYGVITENSRTGLYEGLKKMLTSDEIYNKYKIKAQIRSKDFNLQQQIEQLEKVLGE